MTGHRASGRTRAPGQRHRAARVGAARSARCPAWPGGGPLRCASGPMSGQAVACSRGRRADRVTTTAPAPTATPTRAPAPSWRGSIEDSTGAAADGGSTRDVPGAGEVRLRGGLRQRRRDREQEGGGGRRCRGGQTDGEGGVVRHRMLLWKGCGCCPSRFGSTARRHIWRRTLFGMTEIPIRRDRAPAFTPRQMRAARRSGVPRLRPRPGCGYRSCAGCWRRGRSPSSR